MKGQNQKEMPKNRMTPQQIPTGAFSRSEISHWRLKNSSENFCSPTGAFIFFSQFIENIYISARFTLFKIKGGKIMKYIYALLIVVLLVGGCTQVISPANTLTNNEKAAADDSDKTPSTAAVPKECTETINYQVLIDALPKSVNGFVGDEPQGNTLSFQDPSSQKTIKYSMASVTLSKDDKSIDVSITDTCYLSFLSAAWLGFYEMEGTDGFLKKVTVGGYPGWHQYEKSGSTYSYNIIVAERVFVTVQGDDDVSESDVKAAVDAVGFSAIAAAAK